jgi:hypothetical protein
MPLDYSTDHCTGLALFQNQQVWLMNKKMTITSYFVFAYTMATLNNATEPIRSKCKPVPTKNPNHEVY